MENITFLPKYQRRTVRLTHFIIDKLRDVISFSYLSREVNLSVSTVIRIFDAVQYPKPDMPKVIGIDEFKGNTGCEKYQCILTDIENHKVIDILPNRFEYSLIDYFKDLKRDDTKYFVSDMWRTYANIAHTYFKKATYVIDKYHFVRQVSWAFESVRKEAQRKFNKQRRIYFKRSKKLLLKRYDDLDAESKEAVRVMLNADEALYKAYWLKEDFYDIMKSQSKEEAKKKISDWILQAENSQIVRFSKCADTMRNWFQAICNSFDCAYTNGFTEGCNNKIKVLKRNAYGYRNFSRLRNRILHIFA
jgi:transposase